MQVIGGFFVVMGILYCLFRHWLGPSAEERLDAAERRIKSGPPLARWEYRPLVIAIARDIEDTDPRAAAVLLRTDEQASPATLGLSVLAAQVDTTEDARKLLDRLFAVMASRNRGAARVPEWAPDPAPGAERAGGAS